MSVYFIRAGNYIKIGFAEKPMRRLKEHQTSNPNKLELLGVVEGGVEKERELHEIFSDFRVNGEWFELVTDILAYVADNCKKPPKKSGEVKKSTRAGGGDSRKESWVEFKPGTKRKDGSRLYYPRYRRWKPGSKGKEWCGPVPGLEPMTEEQYRAYREGQT